MTISYLCRVFMRSMYTPFYFTVDTPAPEQTNMNSENQLVALKATSSVPQTDSTTEPVREECTSPIDEDVPTVQPLHGRPPLDKGKI